MVRCSGPRRGFTLVELLVVIGIIAVLVAILLPVIGRAKRQANTVACMATLRSIGQTIYIYASENKGSLPYGYYRSDVVATAPQNLVDESDPNTSLYIWWSVLRSYMGRRINADNGGDGSGISTSSRGMKGLTCPADLVSPGSLSFTVNMIAMPDRQYEKHTLVASHVNPVITPAKLTQLYNDNILMWDVTVLASLSSQYVVGYEVGSSPGAFASGAFSNPQLPYNRYRPWAVDPYINPDRANDVPIYPGSNREVMAGFDNGQRGNIRWRHGSDDSANFLFADGTVRNLKKTTGTPGTANCKGEVLNKFFRIKPPQGFKQQRG
jgi:prepilin-type N-terminal cleavage/methylation domain-containing protein/prepilin-type processing-associated H-X9-DG protein